MLPKPSQLRTPCPMLLSAPQCNFGRIYAPTLGTVCADAIHCEFGGPDEPGMIEHSVSYIMDLGPLREPRVCEFRRFAFVGLMVQDMGRVWFWEGSHCSTNLEYLNFEP